MVKYSIYPTLLDSFYWAKRLGKWQELLDKINRVKPVGEFPVAVRKGMCFEQVVNQILNKVTTRKVNGFYEAEEFRFDEWVVESAVAKLTACQDKQQYIQGIVQTEYGSVKMYGFVDFVYSDFYVDLKTTENYKAGKYTINAQHKCYPLIGGKKHLTYMVTDFKRLFYETYQFTAELKEQFIFELSEFIEWLEIHREEITDNKIFNK